MAGPDAIPSPHCKMGSYPPSPTQQKPCKFATSFLSRAALFAVFAAVLPLLPSQAPEFVSQALLPRSWELLHLLLVGIAVSYGLFSRRSDDPAAEKEALHRTVDTPQSYLTQLLQMSPVFDDDEPETHLGAEENRPQIWSSRFYMGEPTMVVARESSGSDGRPLLLPVRSLRSPMGKKGRSEGRTPPFGHKPPEGTNRGFQDELEEEDSDVGSLRSSRFHIKPRSHAEGCHPVGRSVRTVRPMEVVQEAMPDRETKPEYSPTPAAPVLRHETEIEKRKKKKKKMVMVAGGHRWPCVEWVFRSHRAHWRQ
uniref:Uncharacterized protein SE_0534 n=1 Tax=Anthurium amnicola TaxID=1678845 RepID=A0A1D1YPR5_9ARAE